VVRRLVGALLALGVASVFLLGGGLAAVVLRGINARDQPPALEVALARGVRRLAIPRGLRERTNPVPPSSDGLARARAHFADHCASCHGNDGRGQTALGRNLYPKAPDMTLSDTQRLTDGELFAIIEDGVRLTGMPAWGGPGPEDDAETWELVHFIRHLPRLSPDELEVMKALNPKTRKELEEEEEIRRFLSGEPGTKDGAGAE
jgi:mono/diheme cytochrome c family protein